MIPEPAPIQRDRTPLLDVVKVARDLRSIVEMTDRLADEVTFHADDRELPGGDAMVLLGPSAHLAAWHARSASSALGRTPAGFGLDDYDSDPQPPLLVLAGWEDLVRDERDEPTDLRATVPRAADYLRTRLDWLAGWNPNTGEPNHLPADELATDVRTLRARLENVLMDGVRSERTKTPCRHETCAGARLERVYGQRVTQDGYRCPSCREFYDPSEYRRAQAIHLASQRAEAWVKVSDAAHSTGRTVNTVRTWMNRGHVSARCLVRTRELQVWWPDVREQNRLAEQRRA